MCFSYLEAGNIDCFWNAKAWPGVVGDNWYITHCAHCKAFTKIHEGLNWMLLMSDDAHTQPVTQRGGTIQPRRQNGGPGDRGRDGPIRGVPGKK